MENAPEQVPQQTARVSGRRRYFSNIAAALLPVFACFLGGATEKWAEGIIIALLGLLLLVRPPRFSLGRVPNLILAGLIGCAAITFLPARWFAEPIWRAALLNDLRIALPSTLTPQPWVTFECLLSLVAGFAWFYWLCARDWEVREVRFELRFFAAAVALFAGLCIALHLAHTTVPFWHNERNFGPFPNRNQTADLFAITAVVVLACGADDLRNRKKRWIFWTGALVLLTAAIVVNFSRAGIILLVGGAALFLGIAGLRKGSVARLAAGGSLLLILLTAFLLFGGQTLERFHLRGGGLGVSTDFRWLIFRDAWQLIRNSPWPGTGLGNFEPIFAIFRVASAGDTRAHHPESDWLWLWSELGTIALVLVIAGSVIFLRRGFPRNEARNYRIRLGAFVAASVFALHGLFDVSAHRVGTAFAGVFLAGLALRRPLELNPSRGIAIGSRVVGGVLLLVGSTWTIAVRSQLALPGPIGAENCRSLAVMANRGRNFREAIAQATRALAWTPLEWQLYFIRAAANVNERLPQQALDDFRRARFLEPNAYEVPFEEGVIWLTYQPKLALTAWREALRRAGAEQRGDIYGRMISLAEKSNPALVGALEMLGRTHPDLAVRFLESQRGENFKSAMLRLLDEDPSLSAIGSDDRGRLFALWSERGDLGKLAAFVQMHPDDASLAWRGVASFRAAQRDFRGAVEMVERFAQRPPLPEIQSGKADLAQTLAADPDNYAVGFALYEQQKGAGRLDDAVATVRHFTAMKNAPRYFNFLEMECWAAKGDWERAWTTWQKYDGAPRA